MKYVIFSLLAAVLLPQLISAQENLVLNPGFESESFELPGSWYMVGTVDFYRNSSLIRKGINDGNEPVRPTPCTGNNFIGIRTFLEGTETAIGRFSQKMEKDQWYRISCMALTSEVDCKSNLNGITVFPADSMITVKHWYGAQPLIPYIILKTKGPDERISTQKWTEVCAYYQAKGGERFLWMGNFIDSARYDPKLKTKLVKPGTILKCGTQFYCDDVKVEKCLPPEITSLVIRNIVFDVGSSKVMTVNDNNMLLLVKYLNDFPSFNIRIEGHTDSDGSQQFNQELSLKRAMAVKSWLEERGVASKQISTAGFGKTRPLGSENTPEHKALNRRVEIKFIKP